MTDPMAGSADSAADPEPPAQPAAGPAPGRRQAPVPAGQLTDRMGIVITEWDPKRVVGTMPVRGNQQPYGLLHGGASCVLAESLGSIATALYAGPDRAVVGVEISATHHRPARRGTVTGVCTPLHLGRTIATHEIVITDEDGRRTCTARMTCMILRSAPPGGPPPTWPPADQ